MHRTTWGALWVSCPPHAIRWQSKRIMRNEPCDYEAQRRYFREIIAVILRVVWKTQTQCVTKCMNILKQVVYIYIYVIMFWSGKRGVFEAHKHQQDNKLVKEQNNIKMNLQNLMCMEVWSGLYSVQEWNYGPNMNNATRTGHQRSKKRGSVKEKITEVERNRKGNSVTTRVIINFYKRTLLSAL